MNERKGRRKRLNSGIESVLRAPPEGELEAPLETTGGETGDLGTPSDIARVGREPTGAGSGSAEATEAGAALGVAEPDAAETDAAVADAAETDSALGADPEAGSSVASGGSVTPLDATEAAAEEVMAKPAPSREVEDDAGERRPRRLRALRVRPIVTTPIEQDSDDPPADEAPSRKRGGVLYAAGDDAARDVPDEAGDSDDGDGEDDGASFPIEIDDDDTEGFLRGLLEALLFTSQKPLDLKDLARSAGIDKPRAKELVEQLRQSYEGRGLCIEEVAGGLVMRSSPRYAPYIQRILALRPVRLSRAQLETLAIVAYRQPVTKPEVDDIRGVDSGQVIKGLLERSLLKMLGKKDEPGRPTLYGTTNDFLELLNLQSLKDLPTLREYTELSEESQRKYLEETGEAVPSSELSFQRPADAATGDDTSSDDISSDASSVSPAGEGPEGSADPEAGDGRRDIGDEPPVDSPPEDELERESGSAGDDASADDVVGSDERDDDEHARQAPAGRGGSAAAEGRAGHDRSGEAPELDDD